MLKCFPNISKRDNSVPSCFFFRGIWSWADQWRLWKMLQSCLMDDGEIHSHCCASRLLFLLLLFLPAVVSLHWIIHHLLCHPALNSSGLHSLSIQLIQEFLSLMYKKKGNIFKLIRLLRCFSICVMSVF